MIKNSSEGRRVLGVRIGLILLLHPRVNGMTDVQKKVGVINETSSWKW